MAVNKYLDLDGLAYFWGKITNLNNIHVVKGTQTATTASWTGEIDVDALYDGLTIAYYLPRTSAAYVTLDLTLSNGETTGAKEVYAIGTTRMGTHYGAGSTILLTYWSAGSILINGTASATDRWVGHDRDNNTVGEYAGACTAGPFGMARYSLIMQVDESHWESLVSTSSTGTSKVKNTNGFLLTTILQQDAGTYASGVNAGQSGVWYTKSSFDTRYSTNGGQFSEAGKPFYLVGTITNDKFYLKDTTWWANELPTDDDGYVYWYVGQFFSAYQCTLSPIHPIYDYIDGGWREIVEYSRNAVTVNGHTVEADVPSDAVFTDTTYTLASSSGRGLSLTPSGGSPFYTKVNTQDLVRPTALRGSYDVTLNGQINTNRANRLAFLPADQIIIEKTVDGGVTWTDAGISDQGKRALFSEVRPSIPLPRINDLPNVLCGIRITITAMKYDVPANTPETQKYNYWNSDHVLSYERYVTLREMYFWISAASNTMGVKVEKATGADSTNWQTAFDDPSFYMTGWSGSDYISFYINAFGGNKTQTTNFWNYRITLMTKGANGSSTEYGSSTLAQTVMEVRGYGEQAWSGNSYAMYDHLYSKDDNMNATFPGTVTATNFNGKINDHTVDADVPANAVFTDTDTTYAFASGDANGQIKVTPSGGTAQNVSVTGLGSLAYLSSLSKGDVGLGNVDNTADADKPVSTATQTALNSKADASTTYTKSEVDSLISAVFTYKGTKATVSEVNALTGMKTGDVWFVTADSSEYAYNGTVWEKLGPTIDLSGYLTSVSVAGQSLTPSSNTITEAQLKTALGLGSAAYTESTDYAPSGHTHNYAGSDSAGGPANQVKGALAINGGYRHLWTSWASIESQRSYHDNLQADPLKGGVKLGSGYIEYNSTLKSLDFTFD